MIVRSGLRRATGSAQLLSGQTFGKTFSATNARLLSTRTDATPSIPNITKRGWDNFQNFRATTAPLGATIDPHYKPHQRITTPPPPRHINLSLLLASGAHLGHSTSLWNPLNQRFIFGVRQGIHIFDLEAISAHLKRAAKIVQGVTYNGGIVLFVGNRKGMERSVIEAAKRAGGYHLFEKWIPGTITNGHAILRGGGNELYVRKSDDTVVETRPNLESPVAIKPDLIVCFNILENYILLHEAGLAGIPTIGVVDSDADPRWVTYTIPGNDDSLRATALFAGVLGRAGQEGRERRIREAEAEGRK
ncbi:ribosomal protein S2 [Ascobolus immersus RN42]|uniref:Ribosomal protein S2 n=1 Tax=Ascobolus immersus RN42 TaxID=1160509 RepID=A0A3N4HWG0_ASCIM|nr:ribosomal protein S2 [Ascobolus immersus RN42]